MIVTFFPDEFATRKLEEDLTLDQLAARIAKATAPVKSRLPWLKLARFGQQPTGAGSLRHNDNLISISGIEADYDGEAISFGEAVDILRRSELSGIVYTSPSHTEDTPHWRVLCPLSSEHPPAARDRYLNRLNGVFGGIFDPASWTVSQSYYFGSVLLNPSHRVVVVR